MRKLVVTMWISLDGFIAGPNGDMDWVNSIYDEAMGNYEAEVVAGAVGPSRPNSVGLLGLSRRGVSRGCLRGRGVLRRRL